MRTDIRVLSLRLEDGILITGCGEVWKTETRPVKLNTTLASGRRYSEEWKELGTSCSKRYK